MQHSHHLLLARHRNSLVVVRHHHIGCIGLLWVQAAQQQVQQCTVAVTNTQCGHCSWHHP